MSVIRQHMLVNSYHHYRLNQELKRPIKVITYLWIIRAITETTAVIVMTPLLLAMAATISYTIYWIYKNLENIH